MTLDEFMRDYAVPQIEKQVDDLIAGEPDPEWRAALLRNRRRMIEKMIDVTMIANLKQRLADAEAMVVPADEVVH